MSEEYDELRLGLDEFRMEWTLLMVLRMTMSQAGRLNNQVVACVKVY